MTLVVLGIDALDSRLVRRFCGDSIKLNKSGEMETISQNRDRPHTTQVWPTMATGLHPREHGMGVDRAGEWNNPVIEALSKKLSFLSLEHRKKLGNIISGVTGDDWNFPTVEEDTFADRDGVFLHNWPGVVHPEVLRRAWDEINYSVENRTSEQEFDLLVKSMGASKFEWIREAMQYDVPVVGSQIHAIDSAGHAYSRNEQKYKEYYQWVEGKIRTIINNTDTSDDILIVSDHGICVSWLDEHDIGLHSWYAYSASTTEDRPKNVLDVRQWIEENSEQNSENDELDLPEGQLKELGYIE